MEKKKLDVAKSTQRLHESSEAVKTVLINALDHSAKERVAVELDKGHRNAELTLEQNLRTNSLPDLYEAMCEVTSPAPAAELPWLESFAERLSFFKMNAATNFGMRISQIQAIVARTNTLRKKLGLVSEGFEHRVARLLVNNLCECGPSSIEGECPRRGPRPRNGIYL